MPLSDASGEVKSAGETSPTNGFALSLALVGASFDASVILES